MEAKRLETVTVAHAIELALQHQKDRNFTDAEHVYRQILAVVPDCFDALHLCGLAVLEQGRVEQAADLVAQAVTVEPTNAIALSNLGEIYRRLGHSERARDCCERAIALQPECVEAHYNLAAVLMDMGKVDEAVRHGQACLALKPNFADGYYGLGIALLAQGRLNEANAAFRSAVSLNPDHVEARWACAIGNMGWVYESDTDKRASRAQLSSEIAKLDAWFETRRPAEGFRAVGIVQPFYLAYHETCNRGILEQHGRLCVRLMADWQQRARVGFPAVAQRGRIIIGIVSAHVCSHSVWHAIVKGWVRHLDTASFELQIFSLNPDSDQETEFARSRTAHFEHRLWTLEQWVEAILRQGPDILIYPEIGLLNPLTLKLASLRLAPVQMTTWGHPETSGLPTIDYFLSAEGFEPEGAQGNYTEQLVLLPHLGCAYEMIAGGIDEVDLAALGIKADLPLLLCPGTPFKYSSEHDWVFPEIARKLGGCQLVFFFATNFPYWIKRLRERLAVVFSQAGLISDRYLVFAQSLSTPAFRGVMKRADLMLDTLGFSGFNTAVQALECGLPIVTKEGHFLRGRLASGVLKRMGLRELVADSESAYIESVVKLVQDTEYQRHIRKRINESCSVLYNDLQSIRALERVLQEVCDRNR